SGGPDLSTRRPPAMHVALVVGAAPELLERCRAAGEQAMLSIEECELASVGTRAAHLRPAIILMTEDLYLFDPDEFAALARDTHSSLVILSDESVPTAEIARELAARARG
ncbi:MAG TPA: hypothetical protein VHB21_01570, partial [Minicystis sp.]|nr:hypothetical protein [Minicystis sp.]